MQWDAPSAFVPQRGHGPVSEANDHFLLSEPAGSVEEHRGLPLKFRALRSRQWHAHLHSETVLAQVPERHLLPE